MALSEKQLAACARYRERHPDRVRESGAKYVRENTEKHRANTDRWQSTNPEKVKATRAKQYLLRPEKARARSAKWTRENPERNAARNRERTAKIAGAIPLWVDRQAVSSFYEVAAVLSRGGCKFQVDHIVPLKHRLVCGLHVQDNLQILTAKENTAKGNRWWPGMPCDYRTDPVAAYDTTHANVHLEAA